MKKYLFLFILLTVLGLIIYGSSINYLPKDQGKTTQVSNGDLEKENVNSLSELINQVVPPDEEEEDTSDEDETIEEEIEEDTIEEEDEDDELVA
jgi:hypothetical protein